MNKNPVLKWLQGNLMPGYLLVAGLGVVGLLLATQPAMAQEEGERFTIDHFVVQGNSLLNSAGIDAVLQPFTGPQRSYSDIQRATEALRLHYFNQGFSVVWIMVPEQDLDQGIVTLQIIEGRIGTVTVTGNRYFDNANIRASQPALAEGTIPAMGSISANVQLANENPGKQVDVVLRQATTAGVVDATVAVIDERPLKAFMTFDNTGNQQTGDYRLGVGVQHANLFGRDQVGTFNFVTSPDHASKVSQYSASYRLPLYGHDNSLDFIAAYSDVNAGTAQTVAGPLTFSGKGTVYGLRYNQLLSRHGEYSHQLVYGFDYRAYKNTCSLGDFGAAGCGPAAVDVTASPLSVTYSGNWARPERISEFYLTLAHNLSSGGHGSEANFNAARPSPDGNGGASSSYTILRLGTSIVQGLGNNWQVRAAINAQYTPDALITGEQFGSTGATAVRGFLEREIARDTGFSANFEIYSPDLVGILVPGEGNLRALLFYDTARSANNTLGGESRQQSSIASVGAGLRWNLGRNLNIRFDVARVVDAGGSQQVGDYRGHISLYLGI